ncbi:MAG: hypothetical protein NTW75_03360 [Planctomycetales bacterium]|nr:hypothetical protein [Planctomycetales bacterium]
MLDVSRANRLARTSHRILLVISRGKVVTIGVLFAWSILGCGTTRMSDTLRTGTEQILLSTAIDRSVNDMDFSQLEGKDIYFDPQYLKGASDEGYIVSSIRQKLLAAGVFLKSQREDATYVVEARAGAVGTNRQDVLLGIPQTNLPASPLLAGAPSVIPEIPLAKTTHQRGVAKLAVFAYNQVTGQAVWQSGSHPITADARDTWIFGTGPFQHGTIYNAGNFDGQRVMWPMIGDSNKEPRQLAPGLSVTANSSFGEVPGIELPRPPESFTQKYKGHSVTQAQFSPGIPPNLPQTRGAPSVGSVSSSVSPPKANGSDSKSATGGNSAAGLLIMGTNMLP